MTTPSNETVTTERKGFSRYAPHIVRILLGLMFTVFGANFFFNFIPQPPSLPEPVMNFMGALMSSHLFQVVGVTQLLVGILFLINRFVPLALALLAPILVGIITFHAALDPKGIVMGIVVAVMELYLAWAYRSAFCPMLAAKTTPQ
jgi:uncharacterized membrane protein YphA (DoxX/SURF4 family)